MTRRRVLAARLCCLLLAAAGLAPVTVAAVSRQAVAAGGNPIVTENQQPGSGAWQFDTDQNGSPLKATRHEIEGYASLTSVGKGGSIDLMVSLSSPASYTMQIYRMGWYPTGTQADGSACSTANPCGARLMRTVGPLQGASQARCPTVTTTVNFGLTECSWTPSYTLTVPSTWTTGNYLVKLIRADDGKESYLTFVVRDDAYRAPFVYSMDVTTWQAYNFWGGSGNGNVGYNLYGRFDDVTYDSTGSQRAYAVSFNRPYLVQGATDGAGNFMVWDYPMVRWLESKGYDVTYATDLDIENDAGLLDGRKAFINTGHDEYYSDAMRAHLQGYRDGGAHLGLFSANDVYYRIRFAASSSGQPQRTVVCYKSASLDPQSPPTLRWRDLEPPRPENALLGVMQNGVANNREFRVADASSWIYAGTGLTTYTSGTPVTRGPGQNAIAGIIGYEFDERAANSSALSSFVSSEPAGLQQVGHSAVPAGDNGVAAYSDATLYTTSGGAIVFAAGTMQWSWGLDNGVNDGFCDCNPGFANSKSQQITANILDRFLSTATTPSPTPTPTPTPTSSSTPTPTPTPTSSSTPTPTPAPSPTPTLPPGTYLSDGFESGTLAGWSVLTSSGGGAHAQSSPTNSGSGAAALVNATSGQYSGLAADLAGGAHASTYSRFCFELTGLSGSAVLAQGRATDGTTLWEVDYDAGGKSLDVYVWNGARARTDLYPRANLVLPGRWYCAELQVNEATAGHAQLWLDGVSVASADADLSATNPYGRLVLWNNGPAGTVAVDDVQVATTASGPVGAGAAPLPGPAVTLAPATVAFPDQPVGTLSDPQTVTLSNTGTTALTVRGISLTGDADFAQTSTCPLAPSTLAAGASCTISVTFRPTVTGSRSATLAVSDDAAGSPHQATLAGSGTPALAPAVTLAPTTLTFPGQDVGTTSAPATVTVSNTGTAPLSIASIQLTGAQAAEFALSNGCPASLPPGATCDLTVTFTPITAGTRTASLTVTDNAAGSPHSTAVSGTGALPPGVYLLDGFEHGLRLWSVVGNGTATTQGTSVNSGTQAASLHTASTSEYVGIGAPLADGAPADTYTRFCFALQSMSGSSVLAQGRDANGAVLWEVDYDAGRHGLDAYFWNGARTRYDVYGAAGVLTGTGWHCAEVRTNEAVAGRGEVWLDGTSTGSVDGDLSAANRYARLLLWDNGAAGTVLLDDVVVSVSYNGPTGASA